MAIDDGERRRPSKPREQRKEGVEFELGEQWFTTLPEAPAESLNDLMAGIALDDDGVRVYSAPNLIRFVTSVLREWETISVDEAVERGIDIDGLVVESGNGEGPDRVEVPTDDVQRFKEVVRSKRIIVPIDELGDAAMWVAEKLARRPFTLSGPRQPTRR